MITKIVYEDRDVLVVYKPAGIAVQSARIGEMDVVNEIKNYLAGRMMNPYVAVINRIDQPVHGLVLLAKTKDAAAKLSKQLTENRIQKVYRASVCGSFTDKEGKLTDVIYKDGRSNISKVVRPGEAHYNEGKKSELEYREYAPGKLEIKLLTGRHHQIRVQMANAGHPLLGDMKYKTPESDAETRLNGVKELALCAYALEFKHPVSGEKMSFTVDEELV